MGWSVAPPDAVAPPDVTPPAVAPPVDPRPPTPALIPWEFSATSLVSSAPSSTSRSAPSRVPPVLNTCCSMSGENAPPAPAYGPDGAGSLQAATSNTTTLHLTIVPHITR